MCRCSPVATHSPHLSFRPARLVPQFRFRPPRLWPQLSPLPPHQLRQASPPAPTCPPPPHRRHRPANIESGEKSPPDRRFRRTEAIFHHFREGKAERRVRKGRREGEKRGDGGKGRAVGSGKRPHYQLTPLPSRLKRGRANYRGSFSHPTPSLFLSSFGA